MIPSIVVVDHTGDLTAGELEKTCDAIMAQIHRDVGTSAPGGWGALATVRAATPQTPPRELEWLVGNFTDPDQPGALGYHDMTEHGMPLGKFFSRLDAADGVRWSTTLDHEVLEMLIDPMLALCFQGPDGKIWAGEICDAVEADKYTTDSGIVLSNFVKPSYFQPPREPTPGCYDHMGLVKSPLEIRSGGYNQYLDMRSGVWTMVESNPRSGRQLASAARSRTIRRRYPAGR